MKKVLWPSFILSDFKKDYVMVNHVFLGLWSLKQVVL